MGTFLNGGKVFAAAVTEKRKLAGDETLSDDLKARLQARAAVKRTKVGMQKKSLLKRLPSKNSEGEVKEISVPESVEEGLQVVVEKKEERKSDMFTNVESNTAFGQNDHVRMSI